jgi:hypothetical protein
VTIGKTRQTPADGVARGVLAQPLAAGAVQHWRQAPASDVAPWIERYWTAVWNFAPGEQQLVETLPHPNVYLIFEDGASVVSGVHTARFTRMLEGQGLVFGIKFRPGGFRPFLGAPVSRISDSLTPSTAVFGSEIQALERLLLSQATPEEKFAAPTPSSDCDCPSQMSRSARQIVSSLKSSVIPVSRRWMAWHAVQASASDPCSDCSTSMSESALSG